MTDQETTRPDYVVGRIYAVLDFVHPLPLTVKNMAPIHGGKHLGYMIQNAKLSQHPALDARLGELFVELQNFPEGPRNAEQQGEFWLGFYHEKARLNKDE